MKNFKRVLSALMAVVIVFSCLFLVASAEGTTIAGDVSGDGKLTTEDARMVLKMACGVSAEVSAADINGDGIVSVEDAITVLYEATNIGGVVIPDKNGENFLDDKPSNEFIKLIADTYNLDPDSLVAIYSVPDSGTNYVLQFGNTGGVFIKQYEKSAENLVKVYHIGIAPERKISYTDGKLTGGSHYNCTAAEGWMVFSLVKSDVMAQYPSYFIL